MTPEEVRAGMPADMVRICDALVHRFGAKPAYIQTDVFTLGLDLETDAGWRKYRTKQPIAKYMEANRG